MFKRFLPVLLLLMAIGSTMSTAQAQDTASPCKPLESDLIEIYSKHNAHVTVTNPSNEEPGCQKIVKLVSAYAFGREYKRISQTLAATDTTTLDVPVPDCVTTLFLYDGDHLVQTFQQMNRPSCGDRGEEVKNCDPMRDLAVDEVQETLVDLTITIKNNSDSCSYPAGVAAYGTDSIVGQSKGDMLDPGAHLEFTLDRQTDGLLVAFSGDAVVVMQGESNYKDRALGMMTWPALGTEFALNKECAYYKNTPFKCSFFTTTSSVTS